MILVTLLACFAFTHAWSPLSGQQNAGLSRRQYVQGLAVGVVGSVLLPNSASADVTNKIASSAALRSVQRSQKQLKGLLPFAQTNDFLQVKNFLRTPPFVDVRKNCVILVRGGEDGPKADELQSSYKAFIGSVEKIDSTASLGMRGRKIPDLQMSDEYMTIESTLNAFIKVAIEATDIPVQYDE